MSRWYLFPLVAAIGGIVVVLVFGSLLGAALIIGGMMALAIAMVPAIVELFVLFLSTGKLRHRGP
jgi:hypothetical protein